MSSISRIGILARLRRGSQAREAFVESHLAKGVAHQIRATREKQGLTERELAERAGTSQQAISRLEDPGYGRLTLRTLKQIASALDVGLIVRLVPFSEMADWVTGTPRMNEGLSQKSLAVPNFTEEERCGALDSSADVPTVQMVHAGIAFPTLGDLSGLRFDASSSIWPCMPGNAAVWDPSVSQRNMAQHRNVLNTNLLIEGIAENVTVRRSLSAA